VTRSSPRRPLLVSGKAMTFFGTSSFALSNAVAAPIDLCQEIVSRASSATNSPPARTSGSTRRIRGARFPVLKMLKEFDFGFQPLDSMRIKTMASFEFVANHETILLVGPHGVVKNHLSTALGVKACMCGYNVLFATILHLAS